MCMASYIPGGIAIDDEALLNGGIINGDGSGWAIACNCDKDSGILMGKSMKVEEALDEFGKARKNHENCDALFHSRWATHGTTGIANVHPFLVGGSHKTVVAHNGIIQKCTPTKEDWRSDTRILADEELSTRFRRFDKETAMEQLSKFIGGSKLIILTTDKRYRKNAYLVNENYGHWDGLTGIWHSNYDYLGKPKYKGSYYNSWAPNYTYSKNEKGVWVGTPTNKPKSSHSRNTGMCEYCGYGLIGKAGYCIECGTCEECNMFRTDCECYGHLSRARYNRMDWDQSVIGRKAIESANNCTKAVEQKED